MQTIFSTIYSSKIGNLILKANKQSLIDLQFNHLLETEKDNDIFTPKNEILEEAISQLEKYFDGNLQQFSVPISFSGTNFQQLVWNELLKIPFGETISYLTLSNRIGNIKAIRAVGTANGKNPIGIIIPCHRVIGSNGNLIGFSGGLENKRWLLNHEAKIAGKTLF